MKNQLQHLLFPNEPRSILIKLQRQIKNMSQNIKESLSKSASFNINSIDNTSNIGQMFLIPKYKNSYIIALFVNNDEKVMQEKLQQNVVMFH